MKAHEFTHPIDDDWFKHGSFNVYKKANPVHYERATSDGSVETLEGPVRYETGHYIMTGPKGEQYPISPEKFNHLYDDNEDGTATPKKIHKHAKLADHDGVLHTSWGDLAYSKGNDFIVRHGSGDYGAVKKDIFNQTYERT
jgi:PGDYG protein